jgi:hypothetical protein
MKSLQEQREALVAFQQHVADEKEEMTRKLADMAQSFHMQMQVMQQSLEVANKTVAALVVSNEQNKHLTAMVEFLVSAVQKIVPISTPTAPVSSSNGVARLTGVAPLHSAVLTPQLEQGALSTTRSAQAIPARNDSGMADIHE